MGTSDRAAVGALVRQLGYGVTDDEVEQRIAEVIKRQDHLAVVAEFDVAVGWIHAYEVSLLEEPLSIEVGGLVVAETARRRGSGTLLMHAAERWALERGIRRIRLRSDSKRQAAHNFYRALGYDEVKQSLTFYKELGVTDT